MSQSECLSLVIGVTFVNIMVFSFGLCSSVLLFCDIPPAFHCRILGRCARSGKGLYVGFKICCEKGIFVLFLSDYTYHTHSGITN
jgi:hypothetical protein